MSDNKCKAFCKELRSMLFYFLQKGQAAYFSIFIILPLLFMSGFVIVAISNACCTSTEESNRNDDNVTINEEEIILIKKRNSYTKY